METRIDPGVEEPYDHRVMEVQEWLNETYKNYMPTRFQRVKENGKTGWNVIYGLRRALQIELGIEETSDSFGPTTYSKCPTIAQGAEGNLVRIVQGGLWCKGYNPGGFGDYYGNGTYAAVKALKTDAGFPSASGNMQRDFMKALLDMSAFKVIGNGSEEIRTIQQQLNYDYYDYYQICPCDGLYNRDMNKMLIYALQKELGIAKASATGTWGPTTISLCKAKSFAIGASNPIIKLVRYATVCNGFSVSTVSSIYDSALEAVVKNFCNELLISKPLGQINYTVIKSLLSSNGDTDRSALGCDTATKLSVAQIETIKNAGYKYVGRYLTNTPEGTLDKCLSSTEISNIFDAGLNLFLIFQESGNSESSFTKSKGKINGERAFDAASGFGFSRDATIYFAVDFDPTEDVILSSIVSYFQGVLSSSANLCEIGVYGTRNVCNILHTKLGINKFFVSDASYGFSGNLGFTIPSSWCFDQFSTDITIGSGEGEVSIDKVAVSGKDLGVNRVSNQINHKFYNYLSLVFKLAMKYSNNDITKSNSLVLQFFRHLGGYGGDWFGTQGGGEGSNIQWNLVAGEIDNEFCNLAESQIGKDIPEFIDPSTNCPHDFKHTAATLQSNMHVFIDTGNEGLDTFIDLFSGWMGDLTTYARYVYENKPSNKSYEQFAKENLFKEGTTFNLQDYLGDIDGINLAESLLSNPSMKITDAFYRYYLNTEYGEVYSSERTAIWIIRIYGDYSAFKRQSDLLNQDAVPVSTFRFILNKSDSISEDAYTAVHDAFNTYVKSCL